MRENNESGGLTYREAGVDIDAGTALVQRIRRDVAATRRPGTLGDLGGFGGLFELPLDRYRRPVLVSGTDGVGTKLKLAIDTGRHEGIGIDLVAMCVNDVVVAGAEPLFFLDYYATGQLDVEMAANVIRGIARGCRLAGAGLIGGETAEMPGLYAPGDYDLAGFCVGIVERDRLIDGSRVEAGDALVAIASSGIHANGYSLVRRILERSDVSLTEQSLAGRPLADVLLEPTRIYVHPVLRTIGTVDVRALCHITGGGLPGNLPRVLPDGLGVRIDERTWDWPPVFRWLQDQGSIADVEMYRTFNCGVGMVLAVPEAQCEPTLELLATLGEQAWRLGEVVHCDVGAPRVRIDPGGS